MNLELSPLEARLIGALIEKQITTPDQYPLSLNALVNACNQKSNRDPVMQLEEAVVQRTLEGLSRKHLVMERSGFGSRVPKYQHRFCNTEFGTLKLDPQELAIVCELLLRGPQTPGELRSRASRMAAFEQASDVESALTRLAERAGGPFVRRLAREPGRRESRYAQLFSGPLPEAVAGNYAVAAATTDHQEGGAATASVATEAMLPAVQHEERLVRLEGEVRRLRSELDELRRRIEGASAAAAVSVSGPAAATAAADEHQ